MQLLLRTVLLLAMGLSASAAPLELQGNLSAHDPSTIVKDGNEYWVFATGRGILSLHSTNLTSWQAGPPVFTNRPAWTTNAVPGFRGVYWAPDIIHLKGGGESVPASRQNGEVSVTRAARGDARPTDTVGDRYLLYYSVSTWGSQTSAIGLATSKSLDPANSRYNWTDRGIVIQSSPRDSFNTIDPSVTLDNLGRLWLAFGSYWSGIKIVQLDPATGKRLETNAPISAVAWKDQIEAACIYQHDNYYYLFVNWGLCCRGVRSTYNIRIGRSASATGPYLDREGKDLLEGGGTLLSETDGRFIGPGHAGIFTDGDTNWFSFHYYDGQRDGARTLGLRRMDWSAEGWPVLK
jgi:arabinan endo-1,5-alpha-L-arabinosidase